MAQSARTRVLNLVDPTPEPEKLDPITISIEHEGDEGDGITDGVQKTENPDGSSTIDFNPDRSAGKDGPDNFYSNLANKLSGSDSLGKIAQELLEGIEHDKQSRRDWMDMRARGIKLLGLKIDEPRGDVVSGSAPLEGMSSVNHPLLLEATIRFQSTARGELLPAAGPVKVRNDNTVPPDKPPGMGHNGGPPMAGAPAAPGAPNAMLPPSAPGQPPTPNPMSAPTGNEIDELASSLEKDLNHYLTAIATEYVPDTDRMLFYVGFGGDGFKKVYNCPLRRRPVSESVDAEYLIVSNSATNLRNCGRVTHQIKMRQSTLRRMQLVGAYRDVDIGLPNPSYSKDSVEQVKEAIEGVKNQQRREDADYTIYECYCELDLDEFAPAHFKGKGLPLPYKVTIEEQSKQVLEVRRNWEKDDKECMSKQFFVQFPFIRGLGFYGLGYVHILGNTTNTLTAAWREMLDAGMFASFPGFLYLKGLGRQNTNQFRVPPGGGIGIDGGPMQKISDVIMPLPYKEPGAGFTGFIQHVEETGQRLGGVMNVQIGEGKQDAPVGTTLALIEQATKPEDSVHKRLHAAQAEEFLLLKDRFREDPEALWRFNKKPAKAWQKDQFLKALDAFELVPVADPNNPTSLHRIAKATAVKQMQMQNQAIYDPVAVDKRVMRIVGIDPEGLFRTGPDGAVQPAAPPPDPRFAAIQSKAQAEQAKTQIQMLMAKIKLAEGQAKLQDAQAERASREKIEQMRQQIEFLRLQQAGVIHHNELNADAASQAHELHLNAASQAQDMQHKQQSAATDLQLQQAQGVHELRGGAIKSLHEHYMDHEKHTAEMSRAAQEHDLKMQHMREMHQHKLDAIKETAKVQAKVKPKKEKPSGSPSS